MAARLLSGSAARQCGQTVEIPDGMRGDSMADHVYGIASVY
jgi:hypothetical protein